MDGFNWLLGTVGGWIVCKLLDHLWKRWTTKRATRPPLTDAEVLVRHRRRFGTTLFLALWCAIMFTGSIATAPARRDALWYTFVVVIAAIGIHAAVRLPRYRRRVTEARERLARAATR